MKVCYLVVLLFLITMAQRAGAGNYESNSSNSNFANVSGPRVRSSKNDNDFVIHQIHHIFFLVARMKPSYQPGFGGNEAWSMKKWVTLRRQQFRKLQCLWFIADFRMCNKSF